MDPVAAANKVEYRTQCPNCAIQGRDRKADNLAVYKDGHSYCYSCHYYIPSPSIERLRQESESKKAPKVKANDDLIFPPDYMPLMDALGAKEPQKWLRQYGIQDWEINKHRIGWSNTQSLLIFPVFDNDNNLIMWQGRNFGEGIKYLTKGPKSDILHLVGQTARGVIIVTEDMVSAIKVGRTYQAAPLWGSEMSLGLIKTVATGFDVMGVWLDPNKTQKAVEIALRASQYIPTFIVVSTKDPKDYNTEAITEFVEIAGREKIDKDEVIVSKPVAYRDDDPTHWDEEDEALVQGDLAFKENLRNCAEAGNCCAHKTCSACVAEESELQKIKEARAKSALRVVQAGKDSDSNVKINALFSGHIQCDKCKRKVTMIEDCLNTQCPFGEKLDDVKYTDPNADRPWDYRKEASGS